MITAGLTETIDASWAHVEPIVLGRAPLREPKPHRHVLVEGDGFKVRCDIYISQPECFAFEDAQVWGELLVVGHGDCAYGVDLRARTVQTHLFDSYFAHIYTGADWCLVASGAELVRLARDGTALWRSASVGHDGVVVEKVTGRIVSGEGEWDPPGGWEGFEVSLATGDVLKGRTVPRPASP